jgi:hypothetical protein
MPLKRFGVPTLANRDACPRSPHGRADRELAGLHRAQVPAVAAGVPGQLDAHKCTRSHSTSFRWESLQTTESTAFEKVLGAYYRNVRKKMRSDVVSGPRQVAWECGEQEMYDKASSDVALCLTGQVAGFFLSPFFRSFILSFRPGPLAVVRKAPCRPGSRANCSLLQLCSRRDAWASLHRLGQPDTSLARASL